MSYIDELKELAKLKDDGIITEEEFQKKKEQLLFESSETKTINTEDKTQNKKDELLSKSPDIQKSDVKKFRFKCTGCNEFIYIETINDESTNYICPNCKIDNLMTKNLSLFAEEIDDETYLLNLKSVSTPSSPFTKSKLSSDVSPPKNQKPTESKKMSKWIYIGIVVFILWLISVMMPSTNSSSGSSSTYSSSTTKYVGAHSGRWEGFLLKQYNRGIASLTVQYNGNAKLSLSGNFNAVHKGKIKGNRFILDKDGESYAIVDLGSGFKIVLIWEGVNVHVFF